MIINIINIIKVTTVVTFTISKKGPPQHGVSMFLGGWSLFLQINYLKLTNNVMSLIY